MREFKTVGEMIQAVRYEKPESLSLMILGEEGNGFELALVGNDFGSIVKEKLKFFELNEVVQGFVDYLSDNGIILCKNHVGIADESILANAHHDQACKKLVNSWTKIKRRRVEKELNKFKRRIHLA